MGEIDDYIRARDEQVRDNLNNQPLAEAVYDFTRQLVNSNYVKNFTWMDIPILQYPSDLMVMQEIIFKIVPDVIIETGVAFGGMTNFYASVLKSLGRYDATVFAIDKEIREHTRQIVATSPFRSYITLIESDSADENVVRQIEPACIPGDTVLVSLDSNHTHEHVLKELRLYSELVSVDSYIVVFDTAIEFFGHLDKNQDRPWGKGNNPYTATQEFLKENDSFIADKEVEQRALFTSAPGGWLRRIK